MMVVVVERMAEEGGGGGGRGGGGGGGSRLCGGDMQRPGVVGKPCWGEGFEGDEHSTPAPATPTLQPLGGENTRHHMPHLYHLALHLTLTYSTGKVLCLKATLLTPCFPRYQSST